MTLLKYVAPVLTILLIGQLAGCDRPPVTAAQLSAEANKRITLPRDLGDGFRLDSIAAEGNAIVSTVTLADTSLASDPGFVEVMRAATTSDICREIAPARQAYIDAGLTVAKVYRNAEGEEILRVDVRPDECG